MNSLVDLPLTIRVGWALLNSVWIIAAVAVIYSFVNTTFRSSHVRYVIGCTALSLMFLLPLTWFSLATPPTIQDTNFATAKTKALEHEASNKPNFASSRFTKPVNPHGNLLDSLSTTVGKKPDAQCQTNYAVLQTCLVVGCMLWIFGILIFACRPLVGFLKATRARTSRNTGVPDWMSVTANELSKRMQIKAAVEVAQSHLVAVPSVIGLYRPLILLPVSAITGLTPRQMEAIIAHELAHVRRYDYLINLGQTAIETLLFFHPAIWWVSGIIRVEREICCDELALRHCSNRKTYANALLAISELPGGSQFGFSAEGQGKSQLANRIVRIVRPDLVQTAPITQGRIVLGLVGVFVATAAAYTAAQQSPPAQSPAHTQTWSGPNKDRNVKTNISTNNPASDGKSKMDSTTEQFWQAIVNNDTNVAKTLLEKSAALAGNNFAPESLHTDGFPLYHASKHGNFELVKLLLDNGADPDAKLDVDDPRESGMPLLFAFESGHFQIVHLLLDYKASLVAFPYCSTPFVDSICNATWEEPEELETVQRLMTKSFACYFEDKPNVEFELNLTNSSPTIRLLARVVEMGGQPSLFTVVRHQHEELIELLLRNCPDAKGPVTNFPQGRVFDDICGPASWCGYPKTLKACRDFCPTHYTPDVAKQIVDSAIRSHNRDGGIDEYAQIIADQLKVLKHFDALTEMHGDGNPFTPLHLLAEDFIEPKNYGFKCERLSTEDDLIRLARMFVESGYNVNSVNPKSHLTPLAIAIEKGRHQYANYLRDNGATEPVVIDANEQSNLISAIKSLDVVTAEKLIRTTPSLVNAPIAFEETVKTQTLLHLLMPGDGRRDSSRHLELLNLLLKNGADVNGLGEGPNLGTCTALRVAAWGGHVELMKPLLSYGANVNGTSGGQQESPLHAAARHGHGPAVRLLVEAGAKHSLADLVMAGLQDLVETRLDDGKELVNQPNDNGRSLLHAALETNRESMVLYLLERGAEPSCLDSLGRSPLQMAIERSLWSDQKNVIAHLQKHNSEPDIFTAAGLGDIEKVKKLLESDPRLANAEQTDGTTPLFYAVVSGNESIVLKLLKTGANVSPASNRFWCCLTPIHLALQQKRIAIVKLLVEHGADLNAHGDCNVRWQPTPLHIAARYAGSEMMNLLIDQRADLYRGGEGGVLGWIRNKETAMLLVERGLDLKRAACQTILHKAAAAGRAELVEYWLSQDVDRSIRNEQGKTAADVALANGYIQLARLLE